MSKVKVTYGGKRSMAASEEDKKYSPTFDFPAIKSYLLQTLQNNSVPSLSEFVRLNIDFVARSKPVTNDHAALNGAWKWRFVHTADILGITDEVFFHYYSSNPEGIRVRYTLNCEYKYILAQVMVVAAFSQVVYDRPDWTLVTEQRLKGQVMSKSSCNSEEDVKDIGMATPSSIPKQELFYPEYWDRNVSEWGDIADWDIFFISKFPSCSAQESHMALSKELEVLTKELSIGSYSYQKAYALYNRLKRSNYLTRQAWDHSDELRDIAIMDRIQQKKIEHGKNVIECTAVTATADASRKHFLPTSIEPKKRQKFAAEKLSISDQNAEGILDDAGQSNVKDNIEDVVSDKEGEVWWDEIEEIISAADAKSVGVCLPQEEVVDVEKNSELAKENTDSNEQESLQLQDWDKWATCLAAGKKSAAHICSPENLDIIRCGTGISRSKYMPKNLYASLQKCFRKCGWNFFTEHEAYITNILQQTTLQAMREELISKRPSVDEARGSKYYFLYRIFSQFAEHIFKLDGVSQIQSSEVCYNHLALWPCLYSVVDQLTTSLGHVEFSPGEINLVAVDKMQKLQKLDSQHKADGVIYINELNTELMFLETTGPYGLVDQTRKGWDHVKGMYGCLAMLGRIAHLFPYGSADEFKNIKVVFLHAHDNELHLWTVCVPSIGTYIMQRVAKAVLPDSFPQLFHILSTINLFWKIRLELSKTIKALEKLKASHTTNLLAISLKGKKSKTYLPHFLKSVPLTPNKKTNLAKVASVNPSSSPISEYDYGRENE